MRNQLTLPSLQAGDQVVLLASSFCARSQQVINLAKQRIEALGLQVKVASQTRERFGYFAGTTQARAEAVNEAFADPKVRALVQLRGGWGCAKILPALDYQLIASNPKIVMGFSDTTSLLLALYARTGLVTIHGPVASMAWPEFTLQQIHALLFDGEILHYQNPQQLDLQQDSIASKHSTQCLQPGVAEGRLLGGNLTVLANLVGSGFLPDFSGSILFLEEVNEDYYKIGECPPKCVNAFNHVSCNPSLGQDIN